MRTLARIMGTSDPLANLGHDVFVEILALLDTNDLLSAELVNKGWKDCIETHACRLWRGLALVSGVEQVDIDACDVLASTGTYPLGEYDRRAVANNMYTLLHTPQPTDYINGRAGSTPGVIPGTTPGLPTDRVNWRYVVRSHYQLQAAWARARCRMGWVAPGPNIVWRIKSAAESDTLLSTARMNGPLGPSLVAQGLSVVDRYTSEPLFSVAGLQGYSHLEAGRGFFAFNRERPDPAFEVWRNADARARSMLPKIGVSSVSSTAVSHTHAEEFRPDDPTCPLPRGHYEHFQTLVPPTIGRAYRMHVDREGTPAAAAVLATCATTAIYIWHLEEDIAMEVIERGEDDQGSPNVRYNPTALTAVHRARRRVRLRLRRLPDARVRARDAYAHRLVPAAPGAAEGDRSPRLPPLYNRRFQSRPRRRAHCPHGGHKGRGRARARGARSRRGRLPG